MNNTGSSTLQIMDLLILSFQEGRLEARRVCIIRRNFPHSCRHGVLSMVLKHNSGLDNSVSHTGIPKIIEQSLPEILKGEKMGGRDEQRHTKMETERERDRERLVMR